LREEDISLSSGSKWSLSSINSRATLLLSSVSFELSEGYGLVCVEEDVGLEGLSTLLLV
jgi:hypothetical protein